MTGLRTSSKRDFWRRGKTGNAGGRSRGRPEVIDRFIEGFEASILTIDGWIPAGDALIGAIDGSNEAIDALIGAIDGSIGAIDGSSIATSREPGC